MDEVFAVIARQIEEYSGIHIKDFNSYNFKKVVNLYCTVETIASKSMNRDCLDRIIDNLVIRETFFFREPAYLGVLEEVVKRTTGRCRVLSLGTSTGEEAYSILIHLSERKLVDKIQLTAFDISEHALEYARNGVYSSHSLRKTNPSRMKYFTAENNKYRISDEFRKKVVFQRINICSTHECRAYGDSFDVIIARNFFIYFKNKNDQILNNISLMLCKEGMLVTSAVEFEKVSQLDKAGITVKAL